MKYHQIKTLNPYCKGRILPVGHLRYPLPKARDLSDVDAQLEYGERELTYHLPLLAGGGPVLNLGDGGSAVILGLSMMDHELAGELITVDNHPDEHWIQVHVADREKFGVADRIEFIYDSTEGAFGRLKAKRLRLLFIDADHSYAGCKRDVELYTPRVVLDGLVALHDTNQDDVNRVVEELLEPGWDLVSWVNRLKVFKRRAPAYR